MKALLLVLLTMIASAGIAQAGPAADIKASLAISRQHTMAMLGEGDRSVPEMRYQEAMQASRNIDALLDRALGDKAQTAGQESLLRFKTVWEQFKATHDQEIVPALYAGDRAKAKGLAQQVQAGRFMKMNEILDGMGQ